MSTSIDCPDGADDERRLPAFHVDEIQVQRLRGTDGRRQKQPRRERRSRRAHSVPAAAARGRQHHVVLPIDVAHDADDQQLERRRAGVLERLRLIQLDRHRIARSNRRGLGADR